MSGRTPVNLWATTPAEPGRYELHMSRLSVGELWRMSPNGLTAVVALVLFKVFRLKHLGQPSFLDYPARIRTIGDDEVPERFADALHDATAELLDLGFEPALTYVSASDVARPGVARAFVSGDGAVIAQRMVTVDDAAPPTPEGEERPLKVVCFLTSGVDGEERFWTVDQARDLDSPFEHVTIRCPGAACPDLYQRHVDELARREGPFPPFDAEKVRAMIERDETRFAEIAIARGLYRRVTAG